MAAVKESGDVNWDKRLCLSGCAVNDDALKDLPQTCTAASGNVDADPSANRSAQACINLFEHGGSTSLVLQPGTMFEHQMKRLHKW